jgi:hypothetical protein
MDAVFGPGVVLGAPRMPWFNWASENPHSGRIAIDSVGVPYDALLTIVEQNRSRMPTCVRVEIMNTGRKSPAERASPTFLKCVLQFGIPWILLFQGFQYLLFRINGGSRHYPWGFAILMDIPSTLLASFCWWLLRRRVAWRRMQTH